MKKLKSLSALFTLLSLQVTQALAGSLSAGGTSALEILNTVEGWVKTGSVSIALILMVIGGLKIANGDEKATTAGARLLIGGIFIGCAGWFVSEMIPY